MTKADEAPEVGTEIDFPTAENMPDRYRDMATTPEQFKARRVALMQFIKEQLEPAQMDGKTLLKVNDYYKFPGSDKYALSKKGAESLGTLYRYQVMESQIVAHQCEKDYCYARARVTLHRANTVMAVREASCSSAEKSIQRSSGKYRVGTKVDWRGADNDICARAQKRAYVQAMIAACGASDILETADGMDFSNIEDAEYEEVQAEEQESIGLPIDTLRRAMRLVTDAQLIGALPKKRADEFFEWIAAEGRSVDEVDEALVQIEDKIEAKKSR